MVCVDTHATMSIWKDTSCLFLLAKWVLTISVIDCLYPAITRPLDEGSKTYILNRQLELLLFASSDGSLSKTHHVEHSPPKWLLSQIELVGKSNNLAADKTSTTAFNIQTLGKVFGLQMSRSGPKTSISSKNYPYSCAITALGGVVPGQGDDSSPLLSTSEATPGVWPHVLCPNYGGPSARKMWPC